MFQWLFAKKRRQTSKGEFAQAAEKSSVASDISQGDVPSIQDLTDIEKLKIEHNIEGLVTLLRHGGGQTIRIEREGETHWPFVDTLAAEALCELKAVQPLIEVIKDNCIETRARAMAVEAMKDVDDLKMVEPLITALDQINDDDVLRRVIEAIGKPGNVRAVEPLLAFMARNHDWLGAVAMALANIGDQRAVNPLISTLNSPCSSVIWALGKLGDPRAIEPLRELLLTKETSFDRHEANQVLTKLQVVARGSEPTVAEMIELQDWGKLATMGKSAVSPLIEVLENTNNDSIARKIIEVLGKTKDVRAIEPLVKILTSMEQKIKAMGGSIPGITMDQYRYNQHAILLALGNIMEDKSVYEIVSRAAETLSPVTQQEWQKIVHRALKTANKGDIV